MSSERESATSRVLDAGRLLSTAAVLFHTAVAEKSGLTVTESKAMEIVERLGPLTPAALSAASGLAPASVTSLLDRLERKGAARRTGHPDDKRRRLVEIDPEYLARNVALFEGFTNDLVELCADYTPKELELVAKFLTEASAVQLSAIGRLDAT